MGEAIKTSLNGELVTVASRDIAKAQETSKKFQCEYSNSYEELLKRSDIDAVYIPLPVGLHEEWCIKAADSGKHIISEKSLSYNHESVLRILKSVEKNSVLLYENFMCDFHWQHQKVLDLVASGKIGDIQVFTGKFGFPPMAKENIRYKSELGGGALNDNGAYLVFMARKMLNAEPLKAYTISRAGEQVDHSGSAFMEFPNKIVAHLDYGFTFDYQNNYELWGTKGTIRVDRSYSIPPQMKPNIQLIINGKSEEIDSSPCNHFVELVNNFNKTILSNQDFKSQNEKLLAQANAMKMVRGY